jgi:hypothetical protein
MDYRHLKGDIAEFKDYLRSGQGFDDLDLSRTTEGPRSIDWVGKALAKSRRRTFVTRNTVDLGHTNVSVLNPFDPPSVP